MTVPPPLLGLRHTPRADAPLPVDEDDDFTINDPRMIGTGLSSSDAALLDCIPVVMHEPTYAQLFALGIHGAAVTGGGPFDALHVEPVCFLPDDRFEFARDLRDATGHVLAVIIPVLDEFDQTDDLVAWELNTNSIATWRGAACMLGEEAIDAPDADEDGLRVFSGPPEWLRAGRRGVVILDASRARWRLAERRLIVANTDFGLRLRAMLRLPQPRVYVEARRAAA